MTNITVLKDESLGGVEREYREVKRKANVGERIKIVAWNADTHVDKEAHADGEVAEVIGGVSSMFTRIVGGEPYGYSALGANEYLTLEPSDIIRVNGTRFRLVDRKAAVGERVIVVSMDGPNSSNGYYYKTGDIANVKRVSDRKVFADLTENADYYADGQWNIDNVDYRVLEPVETEPLSAKPAPDQAAEIIAKLTTRVTALEQRVAALETAEVTKTTSEKVADSLSAILTKGERVIPLKSAQEIRDDIVKRAKDDVADLLAQNHPNSCVSLGVWLSTKGGITVTDRVDFVVDREKRTVVALVVDIERKRVIGRGIAKCAPGDVFNAHIGRAISLRRALGLGIPEEYVSAPQPTEIRVGDIVDERGWADRRGVKVEAVKPSGYEAADEGLTFVGGGWAFINACKIVDDSRESDSAEPRKEVA